MKNFFSDASPGRQSGSTRRQEQVDAEHRARGNVPADIGLRERKPESEGHQKHSQGQRKQRARHPQGPSQTHQQDQAPARRNRGRRTHGEEGENESPASNTHPSALARPKLATRPRVKRGRRRPNSDTRKGRKYQSRMSNSKSYFWTCVQRTRTGKRDDLRRTPPRSQSLKNIVYACAMDSFTSRLVCCSWQPKSGSEAPCPHWVSDASRQRRDGGLPRTGASRCATGTCLGHYGWGSAATTAYHARIPILAHLPGQRRGEPCALLTSRVERGLTTCDLEVEVPLLFQMNVNPGILPPDQ